MFKKILLCSDGSEHGFKAARVAADIARQFGTALISLSVYDPGRMATPYAGVPGRSLATVTDSSGEGADTLALVEHETARILDAAHVRFEMRREFGHPVERIVAAACDLGADLIVMGSRGLGGSSEYCWGVYRTGYFITPNVLF